MTTHQPSSRLCTGKGEREGEKKTECYVLISVNGFQNNNDPKTVIFVSVMIPLTDYDAVCWIKGKIRWHRRMCRYYYYELLSNLLHGTRTYIPVGKTEQ